MDSLRIEEIVEQLHSRTAWGICLDVAELVEAKVRAEMLIDTINNALEDMKDFANEYMPDNTAPHPPEDEEEAQ